MNPNYRTSAAAFLFVLLCAMNFAAGLYGRWWMLMIPAAFAGVVATLPSVRIAMASSVFVWWTIALYHDIPSGFRLSMRIAGLVNLPWSIFAYVLIALIAMAISGLAAQVVRGLILLFSDRDSRVAANPASRRGD